MDFVPDQAPNRVGFSLEAPCKLTQVDQINLGRQLLSAKHSRPI